MVIPESITDQILSGESMVLLWEERGFVYESIGVEFQNGDIGITSRVIEPVDTEKAPHMYKIKKTGIGNTMRESLTNALLNEMEEVA